MLWLSSYAYVMIIYTESYAHSISSYAYVMIVFDSECLSLIICLCYMIHLCYIISQGFRPEHISKMSQSEQHQ
jgi:hypothetical protein